MNHADLTKCCGTAGVPPHLEVKCSCGHMMLINIGTIGRGEFACGACLKDYEVKIRPVLKPDDYIPLGIADGEIVRPQ